MTTTTSPSAGTAGSPLPTFTEFAREHVDEMMSLAQKAMAEKRSFGSELIMSTPWGDLEIRDMNGLHADVFVVGCRSRGDRACDRGCMITPGDPRKEHLRILRLMARRARDFHAARAA